MVTELDALAGAGTMRYIRAWLAFLRAGVGRVLFALALLGVAIVVSAVLVTRFDVVPGAHDRGNQSEPVLTRQTNAVGAAGDSRRQLAIITIRVRPFGIRTGKNGVKALIDIEIENREPSELRAFLVVTHGGTVINSDEVSALAPGRSVRSVALPEPPAGAQLSFQLLTAERMPLSASYGHSWAPARRMTVHVVPFSHHDLGYDDYPHKIRYHVRERGIIEALRLIKATAALPPEAQFRWTVETSETLYGFISGAPDSVISELRSRIAEGRLTLGGAHNSALTENLGPEALARLLYTPNRHVRDLLGIPFQPVAAINDVIGHTRGLSEYARQARIPYLFLGPNRASGDAFPGIRGKPFHWIPGNADRQGLPLLVVRNYFHALGRPLANSNENSLERYLTELLDGGWPGTNVILAEASDFSMPAVAVTEAVQRWNAMWAYPRLRLSTMAEFFAALERSLRYDQLGELRLAAPNSWSDMDSADAMLRARARRLDAMLPVVETMRTLASIHGGAPYPWTEIWEAYNGLLSFNEHTNGASSRDTLTPPDERNIHYETERGMHHQLIDDAIGRSNRVLAEAQRDLASLVSRSEGDTVLVFNPVSWERTDTVELPVSAGSFRLRDTRTGEVVPLQVRRNGSAIFVARNLPSLGYAAFRLEPDVSHVAARTSRTADPTVVLENAKYRLTVDVARAGVVSLIDRATQTDLIDASSGHALAQYVYRTSTATGWSTTAASGTHAELNLGAVADEITIFGRGEGASDIETTISLYHDIERIDFSVSFSKLASGRSLNDYRQLNRNGLEAVYLALPLDLVEPVVKIANTGDILEPFVGQTTSSCASWHAMGDWMMLSDRKRAVLLASPDLPLVQLAGPFARQWQRWKPACDGYTAYPDRLRPYFYVMNNMFFTNIPVEQTGSAEFSWSLESRGSPDALAAARFGVQVRRPAIAWMVHGANEGKLPATHASMATVFGANVLLSTLKPAEANGDGLIVRLIELAGKRADTELLLPWLPDDAQSIATDLLENDLAPPRRARKVQVGIEPLSVTTMRITVPREPALHAATGLAASDIRDRSTMLTWNAVEGATHYDVYRLMAPDEPISLHRWIGRTAVPSFRDQPSVSGLGWLANRPQPGATYFYVVRAVNRFNMPAPASEPLRVTLASEHDADSAPVKTVGLRAVHGRDEVGRPFVNLWFERNPEEDVCCYAIHRADERAPAVVANIGTHDVRVVERFRTKEGTHDAPLMVLSRQMWTDWTVAAGDTYRYRVCPLDQRGNAGTCSDPWVISIPPR